MKNSADVKNKNIGFFNKISQDTYNYLGIDAKELAKIFSEFEEKILVKIGTDKREMVRQQENFEEMLATALFCRFTGLVKNIDNVQGNVDALKTEGKKAFADLKNDLDGIASALASEMLQNNENLTKSISNLLEKYKREYDLHLGEIESYLTGIKTDVARVSTDVKQIYGIVSDDSPYQSNLRVGKHFLSKADFTSAEKNFEMAISAKDINIRAEAYWRLALANCRIQPVWDNNLNHEQPICHSYNIDLKNNPNYTEACNLAGKDAEKDKVEKYRQYVKDVDKILENYSKFDKNQLDYDCFICVKATDDKKETDDLKWLTDNKIYESLKNNGVKTFFYKVTCAEEAIKDNLNYEALIMYALSKAKCMLLICSNKDYLQTPWVKNEYTRFLKGSKANEENLIIVFNGESIKLPGEERRVYQDFDRSKMGNDDTAKQQWLNNLLQAVKNRVEKGKGYVKRNEKCCPKCGLRHADFYGRDTYCSKCGARLVDSHVYLNENWQKANKDNEKLKRELESERKEKENLKAQLALIQKTPILEETVATTAVKKVIERCDIEGLNSDVIVIPEGVEEIESEAFKGFLRLKRIVLPDSLKIIGASAFSGCSSLTGIILPDSVKSIGYHAFFGCSKLTNITIPDGVTNIGNYAFFGCGKLTEITIPDGVTDIGDSAFFCCSALTNIILPDSVEIIDNDAFSYCSSLKSISIPRTVKEIGRCIFDGCYSLTDIYYNGTKAEFRKIKKGANWVGFYEKSELSVHCSDGDIDEDGVETSVEKKEEIATQVTKVVHKGDYDSNSEEIVIPEGVEEIESEAFRDFLQLKRIVLPNSLKIIGNSAFFRCSSLTGITLPNSVTSIGNRAFSICKSLTNITLPDSVKSIGNHAFYGCRKLTDITIPDGVTEINYGVFSGCSSLKDIILPDSVTSIGDGAFWDCSSLKSIRIPRTVKTIEYKAFDDCNYLANIYYDGTKAEFRKIEKGANWAGDYEKSKLTVHCSDGDIYEDGVEVTKFVRKGKYDSNSEEIVIPEGVEEIESEAFKGFLRLKRIVLPDSLKIIGASAFYGCRSLTRITIPDGVTEIGLCAFRGCSSLTNITIPDGVTYIGVSAFEECSSLTGITLPDGVTEIGDEEFRGCSSLTEITIPNGVTEIGHCAFLGCSSLTEIILPDSVTSTGNSVFSGCSSLTKIILPDSVTNIGNYAFRRCSSLTEIILPEGVIKIYGIFADCSSLTEITIPDGVTEIGENVFLECSSLTEIILPDSVTDIGDDAFRGCSKLTKIKIPDSVTDIGSCAFLGCSSLTEIILPDSVTSIDEYTYCGCSSLKSIRIPSTVKTIGYRAFGGCDNLTDIYYDGAKARFRKIDKGFQWKGDYKKGKLTVHCSDGDLKY